LILLAHLYAFVEMFDDGINEELNCPSFACLYLLREAHAGYDGDQ